MYPPFTHLKNRRVLVTRAAGDADEEIASLLDAGAVPVHIPLIEIRGPADDFLSLDAAIQRIDAYSWIAFTSRNAAAAFFSRLGGRSIPEGIRIAAVGPTTAVAVAERGAKASIVPERHDAQGLLEAMLPHVNAGDRILFPRAREGRDLLAEGLTVAGAAVDLVEAYRTDMPLEVDRDKLLRLLGNDDIDAVLFASPSAVENYIILVGKEMAKELAGRSEMIPIGPATKIALDDLRCL